MFNPRPRMKGNLVSACAVTYNFLVSIHALTWRATYGNCKWSIAYIVSIHALTWRATYPPKVPVMQMWVSIHALTWRATTLKLIVHAVTSSFNPRPHMEGDWR